MSETDFIRKKIIIVLPVKNYDNLQKEQNKYYKMKM